MPKEPKVSRQRRWQIRKQREGRCMICGRLREDARTRCAVCRRKDNQQAKRRRRREA